MSYLKYLSGFAALLLFSNLRAQEQNQQIKNILPLVHMDSIKQTVKDLTGINPVKIDGTDYTIRSRQKGSAGNELAARYLMQRLKEYGYQPVKQGFDAIGENVYAIKKGTVHPDKAYVICAHYDAISVYFDKSIGADDNASGCAAVMEAARLLKDVETDYSVLFIFFDEEEQGLVGSIAFTTLFDFGEMSVSGVINVDMIGYDDNRDYRSDINVRPISYSEQMADIVKSLNDTFSIGLDLKILNPGSGASDHAPFWNKGIPAIFIAEDDRDFNRYYHTIYDSIQYFHDSFFYKNVQFSIASLSWFVLRGNFVLATQTPGANEPAVYPNPNTGKLFINLASGQGKARVYNMQGQLSGEFFINSPHEPFDTGFLPAGIYSLEIQEEGRTSFIKLIILKP